MTFQEHDLVVLTVDIPEENLEQGDVGTVMLTHGRAQGTRWNSRRSPARRWPW